MRETVSAGRAGAYVRELFTPRLQAALWMTAAALAFAAMILLVRILTQRLHVFEVVFFRNLFGLAVMLPWLWRRGRTALATRRFPLHLLRAGLGLLAMVLWFWSLALLPLAEATALSFTAPVIASLLAMPLLGEPFSRHRILALVAAFAGALLILRPGVQVVDPAALLALSTAVVWGASTVLVKMLGRSEDSASIVTWMVLLLSPLSLGLALPFWRTPEPWELGLLLLLGAFGSFGHFGLSQALKRADAGFVAPFDYLRLPFVAWLAWLFLGETVELWTWLGAACIAAAGAYVVRGESAAAGRR